MDEPFFFANDAVERGGPATAEDDGEEVEGGSVLVGEIGNLPGQAEMGGGNGEGDAGAAFAHLAGFLRETHWELCRRPGAFGELAFDDATGFGRIESTRKHEERVMSSVAGGVVGFHLFIANGIKEIEMANDGMATVVALESGAEEEFGRDRVGVVEAHCDFAANDVLFFFKFVLRESGAEDHFDEGREEEFE